MAAAANPLLAKETLVCQGLHEGLPGRVSLHVFEGSRETLARAHVTLKKQYCSIGLLL